MTSGSGSGSGRVTPLQVITSKPPLQKLTDIFPSPTQLSYQLHLPESTLQDRFGQIFISPGHIKLLEYSKPSPSSHSPALSRSGYPPRSQKQKELTEIRCS